VELLQTGARSHPLAAGPVGVPGCLQRDAPDEVPAGTKPRPWPVISVFDGPNGVKAEGKVGMKSDAKSEFLAIVDRLAQIGRARNAHGQQRESLREREQVIYARHVLEIATARDTNGKAVYSNEEMRRAALTIRLSEDTEFQGLVGKLRELSRLQDELVVEHNSLVDRKALAMLELGLALRSGEDIPVV